MTQQPNTSDKSKVSNPQDRPGARILSASGEGKKGVKRYGKHVQAEKELHEDLDAQDGGAS